LWYVVLNSHLQQKRGVVPFYCDRDAQPGWSSLSPAGVSRFIIASEHYKPHIVASSTYIVAS